MSLSKNLQAAAPSISFGNGHGYRVDSDDVFVNAELLLSPQRGGGSHSLELWACNAPHERGDLNGTRVAEFALDLPRPLVSVTYRFEGRAAARLPLHGASSTMALALVETTPQGGRRLLQVANYPNRETFSAPHFEGNVGYQIEGEQVTLSADGVANPRAAGNLSGSLRVELWALSGSVESGTGHCLASGALEPVLGQYRLPGVNTQVAFTRPPAGNHRLALLLREWTPGHGFVTRDRRDFSVRYEVPATPAAPPAPVAPPSAVMSVNEAKAVAPPSVSPAAAPGAVKALSPAKPSVPATAHVTAKAPAAAASVSAPKTVSIQTASAEALAVVPGLNARLAKAIIAARPFTSVDQLKRVKGIGEKTIEKLKRLVHV